MTNQTKIINLSICGSDKEKFEKFSEEKLSVSVSAFLRLAGNFYIETYNKQFGIFDKNKESVLP